MVGERHPDRTRALAGGEELMARLRQLPGATQLLALARQREDVELVGGAVRDLLLGRQPRELDVVVARDAEGLARELAAALGLALGDQRDRTAGIRTHERFGTALLWWEGGRVDIATRRAESYPSAGALPEVSRGSPEQDLERRDFTVNAIAMALAGARAGTLRPAAGALEDLAGTRLRVLHERSFLDDPTRLLRLARYRARLGFGLEERTAELAGEALAGGALTSVSPARVGAELRLMSGEPDPPAALCELVALGVLAAIDEALQFSESRARLALELLPPDGRPQVLLLALLLPPGLEAGSEAELHVRRLLDALEFEAGERDGALAAAARAPALLDRLQSVRTPSQLHAAARGASPEGVALAGALAQERGLGAAAAAARRWLSEIRHARLQITGDDLLAAGMGAGPEIGRRLEATLRRKLDGELPDDREAELQAALEAP